MHVPRFLLLAACWSATVVGSPVIRADDMADPAVTNSALVTAQHWLSEIDAGQYDESYGEGCLAFHNKVTSDQWKTVLKAIKPTMGEMLTRKLASHTYKPDGFEGLQGECMVITYNSTFTKMPSETEVVVLKREDGQWRGAGYNAQPQADPDAPADNDQPSGQTEVQQTTTH